MDLSSIIASRYLVLCLTALPGIVMAPGGLSLPRKDWAFLLLLSACTGVMTFIGFSAFKYIPPVDANALYNAHPAMMMIVAYLFLKESCSFFKALLILAIVASITLICQPEFLFGSTSDDLDPGDRIIGSAMALIAGLLTTISNAILRHVKHVPLIVSSFIQGFLISLGILLIFFENFTLPKTTIQIIVFVFCALAGSGGRWLVAAAFQREEAMLIAAIQPSEVLLVFLLQITILGIISNYWTIIGCILLVTSIVLLALHEIIIEAFTKLFRTNNAEEEKLIAKDAKALYA